MDEPLPELPSINTPEAPVAVVPEQPPGRPGPAPALARRKPLLQPEPADELAMQPLPELSLPEPSPPSLAEADPLPAFAEVQTEPEPLPEAESEIATAEPLAPSVALATALSEPEPPIASELVSELEVEPEPRFQNEAVLETTPVIAPAIVAMTTSAAPAQTETTVVTVQADERPKPAERLVSLDAFRGFIMLAMASGGLGIAKVAQQQPGSVWETIAPYVEHAAWVGCTPWDLIQPAFMFMVGTAMAFSLAKRQASGQGRVGQFFHALVRAVVLVALGVLLASTSSKQTNWTFTNVLAQIGLGYVFLYLLSRRSSKVVGVWMAFILLCYWLWFAIYPMPRADFPLESIGAVKEEVLAQPFTPWSKHINAAADLDRLLLNELPREKHFVFNDGGYQTMNFVPSLVTMLLGLLCGRLLRTDLPGQRKVWYLLMLGVGFTVAGWYAGQYVCPLVKRIWTPSWVLFSGGVVILMLSWFYLAVEVLGLKRWTWPLVIVGMNSIFAYLAFQLSSGWIKGTLKVHLGEDVYDGTYGPMLERGAVLAVIWLLCWWLYRRRAFLSI